MQQKKRYMYLKNLKNLDLINQKVVKFLFKGKTLQFINRSKDKGVRRLFSKSINKKSN